MTIAHPCHPHLTRALDALYAALGELRTGDPAYASERSCVQDIINALIDTQRDVAFVDREHDPQYVAERDAEELAWRRQTTPYAGGRAVWGV